MILIIAPAYERTVTSVCKWLSFHDTPFIRITLDGNLY